MQEQNDFRLMATIRTTRGFSNGATVRDISRGPWFFEVDVDEHLGTGGESVCDESGNVIADIQGRDDREAIANGNLIAAAPDLYQVVISLMWELKARTAPHKLRYCGAWNSAVRAIERAGGNVNLLTDI